MPQARYRLVDTATTPYYYCISRCVRRAFLCGRDRFTGKNFDHRKQWILDRIQFLSSVFAIDVCAYAIMSNHFHLVLHVDVQSAQDWSSDEVIDRWLSLYKGPNVAHKYKAGEPLMKVEQDALSSLVEGWRNRLSDLSWYMRCLNETIARMANQEDQCTGRFWEGRFRSQALLDEAALISCMTYVDLNPIRAGVSETLEGSEFTSIRERLVDDRTRRETGQRKSWLKPFAQERQLISPSTLPLQEPGYFDLVDWTGRAIRDDQQGVIPTHVQPILQKLGVNEVNWVSNTQHFGSRFRRALGRASSIKQLADRTGSRWVHGLVAAKQFYQ